MSDAIQFEQRGRVLLITINRPEAKNAINGEVSHGLMEGAERLDNDPGLTAGVLTGAGGTFSAGMDLKAFAKGEDIGPMQEFVRNGTKKPLIGAIEGYAVAGGLELALACDLLVAGEGAKLGIPEAKRGLFAAGGGVIRLPARVGYSKAMELALTADPITAQEALEVGLIAKVAPDGQAVDAALELAERIAKNAPLAVAASKQLVKAAASQGEDDLWQLNNELVGGVFASNDAKEGPAAFAEKREPNWTGT